MAAGRKQTKDPFELRKLYRYLRLVDVCDALDGIGYFDLTLMSPEIRPLWLGMQFWGVAYTQRCVPANRPMWKLETTEEIVDAHGIWFKEVPPARTTGLKAGHVIVTDTGGAKEVGFWGSANSMSMIVAGAVGIVTDGCVRDTAELALQKTPVCARARGRTIIPGRIELVEERPESAAAACRFGRETLSAVTTTASWSFPWRSRKRWRSTPARCCLPT